MGRACSLGRMRSVKSNEFAMPENTTRRRQQQQQQQQQRRTVIQTKVPLYQIFNFIRHITERFAFTPGKMKLEIFSAVMSQNESKRYCRCIQKVTNGSQPEPTIDSYGRHRVYTPLRLWNSRLFQKNFKAISRNNSRLFSAIKQNKNYCTTAPPSGLERNSRDHGHMTVYLRDMTFRHAIFKHSDAICTHFDISLML